MDVLANIKMSALKLGQIATEVVELTRSNVAQEVTLQLSIEGGKKFLQILDERGQPALTREIGRVS